MHKRAAIREYVIGLLQTTATLGSNVFPSRVYPMESAALPGACVYTIQEESERGTLAGTLHRKLAVKIDVYVSGVDIDDQCDLIAEEIEAAMLAFDTFSGLVVDSMLNSTEINFSDDGASPNGLMSLIYECLYTTNQGV